MERTETTPISNTVRRAGGVIIAMVALIAAVPAEVRTASGAGGHGDSGNEWVEGEETGARQLPKITVTATRDTIFAGLDTVTFILTREQPASSPLDVTLRFTQEQDWLSSTSYQVSFAANSTTADLFLGRSSLSTEVTESGFLTASVDSVGGYDTSEATASVYVISRDGPVVTVSLTHSSYTFRESSGDTALIVTAQMAAGMPRGVEFRFSIQHQDRTSSRPDLTAVSGQDYLAFARELSFLQADYALENDRWVARKSFPVTLLDDDEREGTENFEAHLQRAPGYFHGVRRLNPDGSDCNEESCPYPVYITDDEDIPELDLSVSPVEIREEDEESSTATVSITNGKTFATDQWVTFWLAGSATEGTDYTVAPPDGDTAAGGHQVTLPADSTSVGMTLTAVDDTIGGLFEEVRIRATHENTIIGETQIITILDLDGFPPVTLTASRDTIFGGLEDLVLSVTREPPYDEPLDLFVQLAQEQAWLSPTSYPLNFEAGDRTLALTLPDTAFSSSVTESGTLTATLFSPAHPKTGGPMASIYVLSREGPFVEISLTYSSYIFEEGSTDTLIVTAQMASGAPRGVEVGAAVKSRGRSSSRTHLTAEEGVDYTAFDVTPTLREEDYALEDGRWVARLEVPVTLLDDDVREGREKFEAALGNLPEYTNKVLLLRPDMIGCVEDECPYSVYITDDEDIPALALTVDEDEIREEDEESSTATVSITNGKTFAADQVVTFAFAGSATAGTDYTIAPADADGETTGHQATLSAGSASVGVTLTAMDDEIPDSNETIEVSATLDGTAIGSTQTIRILNQEVLPRITIAANRDTIIGSMETLVLTLTREAPLDERLTATVQLTQDRNWLSNRSRDVTFDADSASAALSIRHGQFSARVTQSGNLMATVASIDGYDTGAASAEVFVVSQSGPAVTVSFSAGEYGFAEDGDSAGVILVAKAASGMPRGTTVGFGLVSKAGTAISPDDFTPVSELIRVPEADYALEDGSWTARYRLPLTLQNDDVREGAERFQLVLEGRPGIQADLEFTDPKGADCTGSCAATVEIADDEDIPAFALSVDEDEIREEDEESSTATVSITNGKTFAEDQVVTFTLGGTAAAGTDYAVAPADEDGEATGHQVTLAAGSTSVDVTLTAMNDNVEDSNETIEVSATHDGVAVGSTQTIRILNREILPKITIAANRDTIIGSMETLVLTLTREAPLDERLTATVQLTQDRNWLSNRSRQVTFDADSASAGLTIRHGQFSASVTQNGVLTAAVASIDGYDTEDASAEVFVVSQSGPAVTVSFSAEEYRFVEDGGDAAVTLVARAASGMPRGTTVGFGLVSKAGTAISPDDFTPVSELIRVPEADYALEDGSWTARYRLPLTLQNDDVREGAERFQLVLEGRPGIQADLEFTDPKGADCTGSCAATVEIADDEDIPAFALSLSEDEIHEKGETSSTATVSITNGKTFAEDQTVTFELGGAATPSRDYGVTPGETNHETRRHEVTLAAGAGSAEVTFTAIDDNREEGDEEIRLRATHDGDEIGTGTIRLVDRTLGPRVEITFEDVQAPRDDHTAGVATGPFTARFTFSERVEGFTEDDIEWDTHALTTIDSTSIGVKLWDYTVVREGLEYTARMMPDQNGRLWVGVDPGAARSVGTGEGNRLGLNSLWVELPPNRLMVEPRTLTVDEGDADGAWFLVLLTSKPTGTVTVTVSGMDGTVLKVDRPTVKFTLPYWNGGRGVGVTAAHDADTANEQVRLSVRASGGGYEGRGADIVVNIRDAGGSGGDLGDGEVDDEAAALSLLEGVTAEAAAAALFGEGDLSAAQLAALDLLGNRNGKYDLGDLLSWTARCKRGEVCGDDPSPASNPIAGAALGLVAGRRYGRSGHRGSPGGCMHRLMGRVRRRLAARRRRTRSRAAWSGRALLLAAALAWACTDDVLQPPAEADPGYLAVRLASPPDARNIGARLVVEGPGIEAVRASGFDLFESEASSPTRREVIVSGALKTGPVLEFHVPDRHRHAEYRARLLEVAAEDYTLRDPATYPARISR